MTLKFEDWLVEQKEREDHIGDFARGVNTQDIGQKLGGRKPDEHKNWADIVVGMPQSRHIAAFNKAWQEFQVDKKLEGDDSLS